MRLLQIDAMRRGLYVMTMMLLAERSLYLCGIHIHKLFAVPVCEFSSVQRTAELALFSLYRSPEKMAMLQVLDVLCVDELGQFSSGLISILDIILRRLRNSSKFFGGVLVLSTMDPRQLRPIKGQPAMLSPFMVTGFKFYKLSHSVRASRDPNLRRIQEISRMAPEDYDGEVLSEFGGLISEHCTFVPTWDDPSIPHGALRVFGRHDAVRKAEEALLDDMQNRNVPMLLSVSRDEEMSATSHGHWMPASDGTKRRLDRKVKEVRQLYFFPWAVYEMTYNDERLGFSQSQIAVLLEMPTADSVAAFVPVRLVIAPEGCKGVPAAVRAPQELVHHNWKITNVGMVARPRSHTFGTRCYWKEATVRVSSLYCIHCAHCHGE